MTFKKVSAKEWRNGTAKLNLDDFIWTSKGAEAVVRAWAHKKTIL